MNGYQAAFFEKCLKEVAGCTRGSSTALHSAANDVPGNGCLEGIRSVGAGANACPAVFPEATERFPRANEKP